MTQNQVAMFQAKATAENNAKMRQEVERNNRRVEEETRRANVAREIETRNQNRMANSLAMRKQINDYQIALLNMSRQREANEVQRMRAQNDYYLGLRNANISAREADERRRSNMAQESLSSLNQLELRRSNQAKESLNRLTHYETVRTNQAKEQLEQEKQRETNRANLASEQQKYRDYQVNMQNAATNATNAQLRRQELAEQMRHNRQFEKNQITTSIVNAAGHVFSSGLSQLTTLAKMGSTFK